MALVAIVGLLLFGVVSAWAATVKQRRKATRLALRYRGVPYVWGGESPRGFDCSGLIQYVYRLVGVRLPRTTWFQLHIGRFIPRGSLKPGDIVFFHQGGHEALYIGSGRIIEAPRTGERVRVVPLSSKYGYYTARRP